MKERLDVLLVKRNLADSREKAKAIIMSGNVFVEGQREDKAGTTFPEEVNIEVRGHVLPYVSRGGLKLEKAMKEFHVTVDGKVCQMLDLPLADLQTVCFRMEQRKYLLSMWEEDSWIGSCVRIREWYVWRRRISVM